MWIIDLTGRQDSRVPERPRSGKAGVETLMLSKSEHALMWKVGSVNGVISLEVDRRPQCVVETL